MNKLYSMYMEEVDNYVEHESSKVEKRTLKKTLQRYFPQLSPLNPNKNLRQSLYSASRTFLPYSKKWYLMQQLKKKKKKKEQDSKIFFFFFIFLLLASRITVI